MAFWMGVCFHDEHVPSQWKNDVLCPLFKKGDKRDPNNYRGITLLSIVGKMYTRIVYNRINKWACDNNILIEEHNDLHSKRCTRDYIFVLYSMISESRRRRLPLYCFSIDLRKAYDTVWREGLWSVLWESGLRGKILESVV